MWINPDSIVVAQGGSLTIQQSTYTNVFTDIYVDGGSLAIDAGAKIRGNIYAYNIGTVEIRGGFRLDSPHDDGNNSVMTEAEARDGIHIYGSGMVDIALGITSPGALVLPAVGSYLEGILGSANKVHVHGVVDATTIRRPDGQGFSNSVLTEIKIAFLCSDADPVTGACRHFGILGGGWKSGAYSHE
jgi:hypothetical protein